MVVAKCLKLIWNHSGIISGTYFSPFQGVYYLYRGLRRAPKPYFCLILEFWIIFLIFYEWIILLNILDSIEWIFCWINILDFVLNWILNWIMFRPDSMKKRIFKMYRQGLLWYFVCLLAAVSCITGYVTKTSTARAFCWLRQSPDVGHKWVEQGNIAG